MFCVIPNYIHAVSYNNQVIILDMKSDKYYFLQPDTIPDIMLCLATEFSSLQELYDGKLPSKTSQNIKLLSKLGIIKPQKIKPSSLKPFLNEIKFSKGSTNLNWYMENNINESQTTTNKLLIIKSIYYFAYLSFKIKFFSLYDAIRYVSNYDAKRKGCHPHSIENIIKAINTALLIFPLKSKCLLWSMVTTIMLRLHNIKAHFNIGVQNMPFMAHAWVEVDGKIIADSYDIPAAMAVIFNSARDKL
jgi:hypothetical protein